MDKEILIEKDIKGSEHKDIHLPPDVLKDIDSGDWKAAVEKTHSFSGTTTQDLYTPALQLKKDPLTDKGIIDYVNHWKPKGEDVPNGTFIVDKGQTFYIKPNKDGNISTTSDLLSNIKGLIKLDFKKLFNLGFFDFNQVPPVTVVSVDDENRVYKEGAFEPVSSVSDAIVFSKEDMDAFETAFKKGQNRLRYNIMADFNITAVKVDAKDKGKTGNYFEEVVKLFIEEKTGGTISNDVVMELVPIVGRIIKNDLNKFEENPLIKFLFSPDLDRKIFFGNINALSNFIKVLINCFNDPNQIVTPQRLSNPKYIAYNPSLFKMNAQDVSNILSMYDWLASNAQYSSDIGRQSGFDKLDAAAPKVAPVAKNGKIDYAKLLTAIIYKNGESKGGRGEIRPFNEMKQLLDGLQLDEENNPDDSIFKSKKGGSSRTNSRATSTTQVNNVPTQVDLEIIKELGINPDTFSSTIKGRGRDKKIANLLAYLKQQGIIK